MERDESLNIRLPAQIKAALAKAAGAEVRSVSSQAMMILTVWLREHGYLRDKD